MYTEHPSFVQPENENIKVWRYIDFTKLVPMFVSKSLYFARSDRFGDPFEGSYPKLNIFRRHQVPKDVLCFMPTLSHAAKEFRKYVGINCWHMNENESAAMWKLYLKSNEGVSVQSRYSKLKASFIDSRNIYIGQVSYLDYETEYFDTKSNFFAPFMHKRVSFSHEREIRAIVAKFPPSKSQSENKNLDSSAGIMEHGLLIEVDLGILIERIYVAPDAPGWFVELVKSIILQYGHEFEVVHSKLTDRPLF